MTSNEQSAMLLKEVVDTLPVVVAYVDASEQLRYVNKVYELWFGRTAKDVLGKKMRDVVGDMIFEQIRVSLARALRGEPGSCEVRADLPLLGRRELEMTFRPDVGSDGEVRGTIDMVSDVTEPRALQRSQEENRLGLQRTAARLEMMATASRAFAEVEPNLPALLETVAAQLAARFGDTCAITLRLAARIDPHRDEFGFPSFFDRDADALQALQALRGRWPEQGEVTPAGNGQIWDEPNVRKVAGTGSAFIATESAADTWPVFSHASFRRWTEAFPLSAVVAVPLRVRDRVTGLVVCGRRRGQPAFTDEDGSLLLDVADRAAVAIRNARLVAELNATNSELDVLYEVADAVNRAESLDGVYAPAIAAVIQQGFERCALLLFDPDGVMRFKAWSGLSDEYRRAWEGYSPWRKDEAKATPLMVGDVQAAPELSSFRAVLATEKIGALAFVPLAYAGRLLGTFILCSGEARAFSSPQLRFTQMVADEVAAAVGQKQARAEREAMVDEMTRTIRLNETLTGIISHDLRNPLGAILMSATVLSRKIPDANLARTAGRIVTAGQRMNRMITQLLDFTRVRAAGVLPIERTRTDLATVFRQAIDEAAQASAKGVLENEVSLSTDGDTRGWWDTDRLTQVAGNLLNNALRHGTPAGTVTIKIDGRDAEWVTATVTNAGSIAGDLLPVLFEPFLEGRRRDRGGGLGLGLFNGRVIVTAHGGTLEAQSGAGVTTLVLRLPRGTAPAGNAGPSAAARAKSNTPVP